MNGAVANVDGTSQSFTYDAYGQAIGFDVADAVTSLLYSGEFTNANTGGQYLRARFYDPASGRFNRLDPFAGDINNPLTFNRYAFGNGNPISNIDPSGLVSISEFGIAAAISVGVGAVGGGISLGLGGDLGQIIRTSVFGALGGLSVGLALPSGRGADVFIAGLVGGLVSVAADALSDASRSAAGLSVIGGPASFAKYNESFFRGFGLASFDALISPQNVFLSAAISTGVTAAGSILNDLVSGNPIDYRALVSNSLITATTSLLVNPATLSSVGVQSANIDTLIDELGPLAGGVLAVEITTLVNLYLP